VNPTEVEFLVRFICESDAIEGIADDQSLVRTQIEQKYTRGHVGALLLLREHAMHKVPLRQILVLQTQSLIVSEQEEKGEREIAEKYRGSWRDCDVWIVKRVGGEIVEKRKTVSPAHVHSRMSTLIGRLSAGKRDATSSRQKRRLQPSRDSTMSTNGFTRSLTGTGGAAERSSTICTASPNSSPSSSHRQTEARRIISAFATR